MDVLLVAAKKEKIGDYTSVIAQAGRTPVIVDVDAFALQNAYEVNYGLDAGRVVVLLNAGASAININILQGDQSVFTRDISMGGNAYTEAVQKELDLPFEAAEQLKKGIPVDGATFEEAQPVLRAVTENVLLEIQKTFDFFKATASSEQIDRIMLSGGASRVDGFREMLQERFNAPVEDFDPVPRRHVGREEAWRRRRWTWRPTAAVAVGLALQKGGRPMIRINLLGVERQKARKADGLRHRPAADGRLQPDSGRGRAAGIGWWYWSLQRGIGARRRGDRGRAAGSGAAAVAARRGAAVRGAPRAAAAARRADRAAAQRPERARAAARSRQPQPARHAVADRRWSRTATR